MSAQALRGVRIGAGVPFYRLRIGRLALDTAACLVLSLVLVAAALAQDGAATNTTPIKLQLNRLETINDACRVTMLVDNSRGAPLKSYRVDLFAFDTEGLAQKRVAVELGPLAPKKTSVKIFDFPGLACAKVGRVLLNDVLACDGGDAGREACLERTETETKSNVAFDR